MRRIFLIAAAGALFTLISCNNDSPKVASENAGPGPEAERNLAACRAVSDAFGNGDVSRLDSFVASDLLDHTWKGDVRGIDSLKSMIRQVRSTNSDMKMEMLREMADREYVFQWMRFTGNNVNDPNMPKGPYDMKAMEIARMKDGKIVEHWEYMDVQEMMKMMPPANMDMSKKDTAAKK